jgi:hypothetical protein
MEERRGTRRFKVGPEIVKVLTGVDPETKKMVTPAELERMGASPQVVKLITETPTLKPALKKVPPGYYTSLFKRKPQ